MNFFKQHILVDFASHISVFANPLRRWRLWVTWCLALMAWCFVATSAHAASGTITFANNSGLSTPAAQDGQGGSSDISGITIQITNNQNYNWTYETPYGPGAIAADYAGSNHTTGITIKSSSTAVNFNLLSLYIADYGGANNDTVTVTGYDNGASTGSFSMAINNGVLFEKTYNQSNGLVESVLRNVDEVRITPNLGTMFLAINNIQIGDPITPPSVTTNAATSITATGAVLNGNVNDNGSTTTVTFDYGLTTSYGTNVAATTGGTVNSGSGSTAVATTLSGLTCNTTYHFRAKGVNGAGTINGSDASFTTAACVPGAPTIGTATAGDAQASVTFTAPASNGGASITGYTVTSSPGNITGSGAASPITVTGLINGTAYTFTVTATNSAGPSSASAASNSVTPKAAQTITFANPGARNFGTTPTLSATATSGLTVAFTSSTTGVCTITSGGALTFVTPGTCTINADQAGNGAYVPASQVSQSFAVNAVVPSAPTIGTATAGDAQASVTFTAPGSNGGAAITGYTVSSSPGGLTGTGANSPISVTGLTNGTAYTFTVTATNSAGTGSASAASNSVTPKAAQTITFANPGAQNFGTTPTLTATSTSALTVAFTSSTTGVCTITSGGALTFVTAGNCTINADQAGNGTYAPASQVAQTFTVNAVVPGAPTIGTATAGDTQASVTFTAPASNGGASITGYTVTSSPGNITGSGAASPITVTGLTNGTAYTFTVTATNSAGPSSASAASNSVTPKAAQTITFANPGTQNFGTTPTLTATSTSALTVAFTSSTTGVCTITSGGALTFVTTGTCTINADQAGDGSFLVAPQVSRSFTVAAVVPGAPTIGVASAGDTQASVAFTAPASNGGATITSYTVTSSPGNITGSGGASPITVTGLTNGTAYTFTVTATNSAGPSSASAASNSVTPSPGPVVVSVAVPANGTYKAGANLDFTVTWDQNTTVTGTPRISLVIGATSVQANYVSSPTATTTLFRYTVQAGQNDSDGITVGALGLNGGTIQNATNTNATLTLNSVGSTAAVLVDTTAPTLPAANIVVNNQADPHKVVLTFSEPLANGSLGSAAGWAVTANGGTPSYGVASVALTGGNIVTLTLNAVNVTTAATTITNAAANAHIKVTPPAGLTDAVGNTYAAGLVTEAGATHVLDATAPTLSAVATSGPTSGSGTLAATASEKALGYWIAVASGATAPNVAQTKAGVNYAAVTVVAQGSGALPAAAAGSVAISGLSASTAYDIYVVAEDAAGNLSAAVSTTTLTTTAAVVTPPTPPFTTVPTPTPPTGVSGSLTVIDMTAGSAPALGTCAAQTIQQLLGGDARYIGQTASGATQIAWNGQIISFYPLAASASDNRIGGVYSQSSNPLDVVTNCGTLRVAPAAYNLSELAATLVGMGLTAQITADGVITVLVNGVTYVLRPDFMVTPGTPGAPRVFQGDDGLFRFSDSAGNTQIMRPAFLDTTALQTAVSAFGGAFAVQADGTVLLAIGGKNFVLVPDMTLGGIPPEHATDSVWPDGPSRYRYRILLQPYAGSSQGVSVVAQP
jgi:hypothetical protein